MHSFISSSKGELESIHYLRVTKMTRRLPRYVSSNFAVTSYRYFRGRGGVLCAVLSRQAVQLGLVAAGGGNIGSLHAGNHMQLVGTSACVRAVARLPIYVETGVEVLVYSLNQFPRLNTILTPTVFRDIVSYTSNFFGPGTVRWSCQLSSRKAKLSTHFYLF